MDKSRAVYGIDLGTTYSCIAQVDKYDQAVVLANFEGDVTTPSAVYFEDEQHVIVGKEAKGMLATEPDKTVVFVKRQIGIDEAFNKATNNFPYHYDPSEISAFILKNSSKTPTTSATTPSLSRMSLLLAPLISVLRSVSKPSRQAKSPVSM